MSDDSLIDRFDKRVASVWVLIAVGASKSIEQVIVLLSKHVVDVDLGGIDVTLLALYLGLLTASTTVLIMWHTLQ